MTIEAREALTVFVRGREIPGIIVYGLRELDRSRHDSAPRDFWPADACFDEAVLTGESWSVVAWEIGLPTWPDEPMWSNALNATLDEHLNAGSRVAWVGAEGVPFCDPPELFDPRCMSGGVLAWKIPGSSGSSLDPRAPVAPASDDDLAMLRKHSTGLADVR